MLYNVCVWQLNWMIVHGIFTHMTVWRALFCFTKMKISFFKWKGFSSLLSLFLLSVKRISHFKRLIKRLNWFRITHSSSCLWLISHALHSLWRKSQRVIKIYFQFAQREMQSIRWWRYYFPAIGSVRTIINLNEIMIENEKG